jgi:hypothetical protein
MIRFEELTGKSLLQGLDFSKLTAFEIAALVSSCLTENITPGDVAEMITPGELGQVIEALIKTWEESVPESEGNPPSRPTG